MRNEMLAIFLAGAAAMLLSGQASAVATYTYTGNNFTTIQDWSPPAGPAGTYTTAMSVSGSFTVASPLAPNLINQGIAPLSFSFSDGRNSITHTTSLATGSFYVSTDAQGGISEWWIELQTPSNIDPIRSILSLNSGSPVIDQGSIAPFGANADSGKVADGPGTWTFVPAPSVPALSGIGRILLGLGFAGIALRRSPFRRSSTPSPTS